MAVLQLVATKTMATALRTMAMVLSAVVETNDHADYKIAKKRLALHLGLCSVRRRLQASMAWWSDGTLPSRTTRLQRVPALEAAFSAVGCSCDSNCWEEGAN